MHRGVIEYAVEDFVLGHGLAGVVLGLSGNAPAQVNVHQVNPVRLQPLPQGGKDAFHEVIPFGVHIPKGTTDKNSNCSPPSAHT